MTTKVVITLEQFTGYAVNVYVQDVQARQRNIVGTLSKTGDSVEAYVHQNQDVVVGEIKTNAA